MTVRSPLRSLRQVLLLLGAALTLAVGGLVAGGAAPASAASLPCDIYASAGTPCVAAHSTTRALYAAYDGPLYQVRRASDNATTNIYPLSAGGVANAAAQDSFCAGTTCVITEIYDQSGHGNNLTQAPGGGAAGGPDNLANATAAPVMVGGHKAYGVYVAAGHRVPRRQHLGTSRPATRRRASTRSSTARTTTAAAASTTATPRPTTTTTAPATWRPSTSATSRSGATAPATARWIMADMENGLYSGQNAGYNADDPTIDYRTPPR